MGFVVVVAVLGAHLKMVPVLILATPILNKFCTWSKYMSLMQCLNHKFLVFFNIRLQHVPFVWTKEIHFISTNNSLFA